jgi:hypothetical protein
VAPDEDAPIAEKDMAMSTVTTMADKMIRSASRALAGSRLTRRSFFARTAVLGSALTIDPVGFATKPVSA